MNMVMIDFESLGVGMKPVLLSFGAVLFDIHDAHKGEYYSPINIQSCQDVGMDIDTGTLQFWMQQDAAARQAVFGQEMATDLADMLRSFNHWFNHHCDANTVVWFNGAIADARWLEAAYELCHIQSPIGHWQYRDMKGLVNTLVELDYPDPRKIEFDGVKHFALDDCKHQIKILQESLAMLKGNI